MTLLGEVLLIAFIGLAGGIAVGSGMVAFLVVLDIIPRLAQITRTFSKIRAYEAAVVLGSLLFTWVDFSDMKVHLFPISASLVGLFAGCFVGMLAAALTEIINVLPILAKRVGMGSYMILLLMAMIFGKVFGSLFEWLFY
ncbi:stage V sporulation protein AB [Paenibacillus sp. CGMCC 1.16610]|uniref:Stage V sporulation protein AB n=1 Tax=Paenibacillus anseongense TaxID=2682845 RepID=A0ABW9U9W9_9BACL|nr:MULTISPECIES: stage V sporulation protein AB [Paenibacillus]MBA2942217.1 stage V sporulation protein AB [Paenibacillus sp. CGMCC 1.16610]MVQ36050.1 stage V sporulation protein AB [Paenibacillus anseongense]